MKLNFDENIRAENGSDYQTFEFNGEHANRIEWIAQYSARGGGISNKRQFSQHSKYLLSCVVNVRVCVAVKMLQYTVISNQCGLVQLFAAENRHKFFSRKIVDFKWPTFERSACHRSSILLICDGHTRFSYLATLFIMIEQSVVPLRQKYLFSCVIFHVVSMQIITFKLKKPVNTNNFVGYL